MFGGKQNRLWNVTNPYQGKDTKVLCVCSAGLLRSPTAANVLHQEFGYNTRAAGCETDHALIPIDEVLLSWADSIVVMEQHHKKRVEAFGEEFQVDLPTIIVLGIEDAYPYGDSTLKSLIKE